MNPRHPRMARKHPGSAKAFCLTVTYSVAVLVAVHAIRRLIQASTLSPLWAELVGATALSLLALALLPLGRTFGKTLRMSCWTSWQRCAVATIILLGSFYAISANGGRVHIARAAVVAANEELVFRVLLANRLGALWSGMSRPLAWVLSTVASSIAFGLAHVPDFRECDIACLSRTQTVLVAGMVLSLVRLVAGVGAAIGLHTAFNGLAYSGTFVHHATHGLSTLILTGVCSIACGAAYVECCQHTNNGGRTAPTVDRH
jgi:membrane protease YdiL (CAAX protease family)